MSYFTQKLKYRQLTPVEEKTLFEQYHAGGDTGEAARQMLLENFLQYALSLVQQMAGNNQTEDLVAAAYAGLEYALKRFDHTRGECCFATYSRKCIRGHILKEMQKEHRQTDIKTRWHHELTRRENLGSRSRSDFYTKEGIETYREDDIPRESGDVDLDFDTKAQIRNILGRATDFLNPRQRECLVLVYFESKSYADVAREWGVTRERVRQIHNRAILKLRNVIQ